MKKLTVMGIIGKTHGVSSETAPQKMPERMNANNPSSPLRSPPAEDGGGASDLLPAFGGSRLGTVRPPDTSFLYCSSTATAGSEVTLSGTTNGNLVGSRHWPCALQTMTSTVTAIFFSPGSAFGLTTRGR